MARIKKILVPVDFSKNSQVLVDYALDLARSLDAHVTLFNVAETFADYLEMEVAPFAVSEMEREIREVKEAKMARLVESLRAKYADLDGRVVSGLPADEINKAAEEGDYDLIVIGTHGYRGLDKVMLGSVANRVLRRATRPVLRLNPYSP